MITSPHYAKDALERLTIEMRKRLLILTNERVRDIHHLNIKRKKHNEPLMPRIIVIVDELGDLMLQDRKEFIKLFAEISQISRATGIHMICATQRPSVDVLPGKIKVNFPGRMSFRVTSSVDSKTIIQQRGAENLLGRGDMLYLSPQRVGCVRVHAPWVPIEEIKELTEKIKAAAIAEMKVDIKPKVEVTTETEGDKNIPIDLDWNSNNRES
jgi:S-DNA-T family DNA segregation ATPase FtsK/SpoIIIE